MEEQLQSHVESPDGKNQLPPAELIKSKCSDVLKSLRNHRYGWVFNNPVDPVKMGLPDYFDIIKKPMDLGTIQKKVDNEQYNAIDDFAADVHLTFDNAMLYNGDGSDVHNMAKQLRAKFEKLLRDGSNERTGEQTLLKQQWIKMLKRLQAYQQEHNGSCNVPARYPQDQQLGTWVHRQRGRYKKGLLTKERCDQLEAIGFELNSYEQSLLEQQWIEMLNRLQAYQQEHNGSCNVPQQYPPDRKLGRWVGRQRCRYMKGLLTKERCDQLEAIGFEWTLNREQSFQDKWNKMFKKLQAYQQEHGHCRVGPTQDQKLSLWIYHQRRFYKKGSLSKERCDNLNEIGFEWRIRDATQEAYQKEWDIMFKRLQAYQLEHDGSCAVPNNYRPDPKLANWVVMQRFCRRKGKLLKERFDRLEATGFEWICPKRGDLLDDHWAKMFTRLRTYQQEHNGSCDVPEKYSRDPELGYWVIAQRHLYKKGAIKKERYDQLNKIGFEFAKSLQAYQDKWIKMFKKLQVYKQEHGHCNVPHQYPPERALGFWVNTQRSMRSKGSLDKERCDQLEEIGFQWRLIRKRTPRLLKVSKTKETDTLEPQRMCWI